MSVQKFSSAPSELNTQQIKTKVRLTFGDHLNVSIVLNSFIQNDAIRYTVYIHHFLLVVCCNHVSYIVYVQLFAVRV